MHHGEHHWYLDQDADDRSQRRTRLEAKQAYCNGPRGEKELLAPMSAEGPATDGNADVEALDACFLFRRATASG